jgi:hypothetical protein
MRYLRNTAMPSEFQKDSGNAVKGDLLSTQDAPFERRGRPRSIPSIALSRPWYHRMTCRPGVSRTREPPSPGGHGFETPNSLFARTAHIGLPADEVHESGNRLCATYLLSSVGACSPAVPISDHDV